MPDPSVPPVPGAALPLHFGRFMLDPVARQLLADGVPLTVGARGFDLLLLLARRAPHAVASDELQRLVWPGRSVAGNNVRVQITALRKLLGDGVIDHQPTRGYRLVPAVDRGQDGQAETALPPPPGNLPQAAPALYGRDAERHALCQPLAGAARLTLAGPAGAGKTVLAQALAHDRRRLHAQGVWWVDLAPLADGAQLAERVAATLGLVLGRGDGPSEPTATLAHALDRHDVLLVLDNAEHLAADVSRLADDLLRHAPGVALLVTSRRSIKCAGEQLHRLDALSLPDGPGLAAARRSGAVAVFEGRARRADPGFALTETNVDAVVDICRRLDGLALAIVLAAARLPLLGVTGLRDRLADRWRLLASHEVDARGHPQALSAALDWSFALLSSTQQALLRRLGVFAGSFALDAVQAVLGGLPAADDAPPGQVLDDWALLDALNALLDHSLLMPEVAALEGTAPARYRLHESVRLYAAERLMAHPEVSALQARHARHLLARVTGQPGLAGDEDLPRRRMDALLDAADHDNLRAAIDWAATHDLSLALRLAAEANPYFRQRCHHLEARQLHTRLLAHPQAGQHPRRQARVHLAMAALCFEQHELDQTLAHAQAAAGLLEAEPHASSQGEAQGWVGAARHSQRDFLAAERAYRQAMAFHTAAGHADAAADQLNNLGLVHMELGDHAQATRLLQEALALHRRQGSKWGEAIALENLGEAAYIAGDLPAAERHWQAALPLVRELGHLYHESLMLQYLGQLLRRQGRPLEARAQLRVSLSISRPQRLQGLVCDTIALLAGVCLDTGQPYRAGVLLQVSERLRVAALTGPMTVDLPAIRAGVRAALADDDWHAARAEGDRLPPEDVQA